jgi:hypothetical protein
VAIRRWERSGVQGSFEDWIRTEVVGRSLLAARLRVLAWLR